jgi:hypothetical protein
VNVLRVYRTRVCLGKLLKLWSHGGGLILLKSRPNVGLCGDLVFLEPRSYGVIVDFLLILETMELFRGERGGEVGELV